MKDPRELAPQVSPIAAGIVLVCAGAVLSRLRPDMLSLPDPVEPATSPAERWDAGDRTGATAQGLRDSLLILLPPNLFAWMGTGLMVLGGSVVAARLLDLMVDDEGMGG